jgi:hypothetical protein
MKLIKIITFFLTLIISLNGVAQESEPTPGFTPKSTSKAVMLSVLLPGLGQAYAGKTGRMYPYLGVEAATWTVYGIYRHYGNLREDDYQLFASTHAGIDPHGKDSDYYNHLEDYMSSEDYNEDALRESRLTMYSEPPTLYGDEDAWQWDSETSQEKYQDLKHDSWLAHKKATYTLGFAVLNRIVSAIDAARQVKIYNQTGEKSAWNIRFTPITKWDNYGGYVVFNYKR